MKRRISVVLIFLILLVLIGCSSKVNDKNKINIGVKQSKNINSVVIKNTPVTQNKNLTMMLIKEKHVKGGQIYEQNGMIIGVAIMDNKTTKAYAQTIANKYLKLMKSKYKNMKMNFQVVAKGKNLINIMSK